jgi:hypothetical protein
LCRNIVPEILGLIIFVNLLDKYNAVSLSIYKLGEPMPVKYSTANLAMLLTGQRQTPKYKEKSQELLSMYENFTVY